MNEMIRKEASGYRVGFLELLDRPSHLKDGQIHNNDDRADDDAHGEEQHWFDPRGHAGELEVQTPFIEVGDVAQHRAQRPGFFSHRDHLCRELGQHRLLEPPKRITLVGRNLASRIVALHEVMFRIVLESDARLIREVEGREICPSDRA